MDDNTENGLDAIVGWNAVKVARIIGAQITAGFAAHDMSLVQFGVLSCLADGTQMTSADIARAVFVRPQSMAQVLDGMQHLGLIQRAGVRAKGRRNPVQITDAGRQALTAAQRIALASNDLSTLGLNREQSAHLNALLLTIIRTAAAA